MNRLVIDEDLASEINDSEKQPTARNKTSSKLMQKIVI